MVGEEGLQVFACESGMYVFSSGARGTKNPDWEAAGGEGVLRRCSTSVSDDGNNTGIMFVVKHGGLKLGML